MPLETGDYICDLVETNPPGSDNVSQGDDHLRLVKHVLKTTFPNVCGAVTVTHDDLNTLPVPSQAPINASYGLSAPQAIPQSTPTKVAFDVVVYDTDTQLDGAGTFTCKHDGLYIFNGSVQAGQFSAGNTLDVSAYKNGALLKYLGGYDSSKTTNTDVVVSFQAPLVATDTVDLRVTLETNGDSVLVGSYWDMAFVR